MKKLSKPLLIYDGECRFCCRWIERWKEMTGDKVDYEASQNLAGKFSEIAPEEFEKAVQWIGADGKRRSGAEAVLSAMALGGWLGDEMLLAYRNSKAFARLAEGGYALVARNRGFFSLLTRLLWGNDVRPPKYAVSNRIYLRVLGVIYFLAFLSFGLQCVGLIGENGILPARDFFTQAHARYGPLAFWEWPSFCWLGAGDAALRAWWIAGLVVSVVLAAGYAPMVCLVFLWANYLSLTIAGQNFYWFQWDTLLLEAGFMAIFLAPLSWRLKNAGSPPGLARFLTLWLLFRLMFASGVVKLASGDASWWDGTALTYHYFTQPLPTPLAWWAHQAPAWWQWLSVKVMFFVELVLPFFLFAPRRLRLAAAGGIVLFQVLIALTGNYGFFNVLTVALCLLAVDDAVWFRWLRRPSPGPSPRFLPVGVLLPAMLLILTFSLSPLLGSFRQEWRWLDRLNAFYQWVAPFRTINGYGLFAVMTTERREIRIEGSEDGVEWKAYVFHFKPGDPHRAPPWVAPYMPRLDWQMWFAALGDMRSTPWFGNMLVRLMEGSPDVLALLETNPFPGKPPRYVRAESEYYTFTTPSDAKGLWWKTTPGPAYCPSASLRER